MTQDFQTNKQLLTLQIHNFITSAVSRAWAPVRSLIDYAAGNTGIVVKLYNTPPKIETVVIPKDTAKYLAVLLGQTNWGNKDKRRQAIDDLNKVVGQINDSIQYFDWNKK